MATERAVVYGSLYSVVQIRHMFTCDVLPSGGDTQQVLWSAYILSVLNPVVGLLTTGTHFYSYELQSYSAGHWVPYDTVNISKTGVDSSDPLPNAVATVLLGKASGLRHVGRKFLGGLAENNVTGNTLTAAALIVAATTLAAYITPFTGIGGGTITPGVIDNAGTFHPFVGGVVSSLLGSMRRRKPGVGI